jgi:hypothetical protein
MDAQRKEIATMVGQEMGEQLKKMVTQDTKPSAKKGTKADPDLEQLEQQRSQKKNFGNRNRNGNGGGGFQNGNRPTGGNTGGGTESPDPRYNNRNGNNRRNNGTNGFNTMPASSNTVALDKTISGNGPNREYKWGPCRHCGNEGHRHRECKLIELKRQQAQLDEVKKIKLEMEEMKKAKN